MSHARENLPDGPPRPGVGGASTPPARPADQGIADWIFETVKRELIEGRIPPEEVLVEGAIADRFGVSRGPARETLQRLRRTGLIRAMPRVGYIVTTVSLRDYDEVFHMRLALEPLAAELATLRLSRGHSDARTLQVLADAVRDDVDDRSDNRGMRVAQLNRDFHFEVAKMAGSRRLERTIGSLLDDLQRIMHILAYDENAFNLMHNDHPDLVNCIKQGDPTAARKLMHNQLTQAYALMRDYATNSDAIFFG